MMVKFNGFLDVWGPHPHARADHRRLSQSTAGFLRPSAAAQGNPHPQSSPANPTSVDSLVRNEIWNSGLRLRRDLDEQDAMRGDRAAKLICEHPEVLLPPQVPDFLRAAQLQARPFHRSSAAVSPKLKRPTAQVPSSSGLAKTRRLPSVRRR